MLHQTQGIVIHTVPYSDNRVIAKIYTRDFGLQSFIVTVSRSKSGKIKSPLLQPLTQLELRVEIKEKSHLHSIKDIALGVPYQHLHNDIVKTSLALFTAELLHRTVREEERNEQLYDYISKSVQLLDLAIEGTADFHLLFMMSLTKYLGFYPLENEAGEKSVFDLVNGIYIDGAPGHFNYLDESESRLFELVSRATFEDMGEMNLNGEKRKVILNTLLRYYEAHIPAMQKMQSHEILSAVLTA
jgi:DNA repair protein RecO (recombination protein O)